MSGYTTPRAAIRAALAAVTAALILSPPTLAERGEPAGGASASRSLLHDGDSLGVGTQLYLPAALPGWRIRSSLAISRHAWQGPPILRRYGSRLPGVIVVSLGTNDDPRALGLFRRAIRDTMHIAGPRRCVVWANIVRPPVAGRSYAGMNVVLAEEARRRRNLRVFQWGRMINAHRGWLAPDGVHVPGFAYRIRARGIAEVARRCR